MIILDLETVAAVTDKDPQYAALTDEAARRAARHGETQTCEEFQTLCPLFARPVAAAILNSETNIGCVIFDKSLVDCPTDTVELDRDGWVTQWTPLGVDGEKNVLVEVNRVLTAFSKCNLVTFNGRGYDLPVLSHRSRVNGLKPAVLVSRSLNQKPWEFEPHIDLCNVGTFGGAMQRYSLRAFALAYGLKDPKANGSGADVKNLVAERDGFKLCLYAAGDVLTTHQIFLKMYC